MGKAHYSLSFTNTLYRGHRKSLLKGWKNLKICYNKIDMRSEKMKLLRIKTMRMKDSTG